jgi:hypothetical protein
MTQVCACGIKGLPEARMVHDECVLQQQTAADSSSSSSSSRQQQQQQQQQQAAATLEAQHNHEMIPRTVLEVVKRQAPRTSGTVGYYHDILCHWQWLLAVQAVLEAIAASCSSRNSQHRARPDSISVSALDRLQ